MFRASYGASSERAGSCLRVSMEEPFILASSRFHLCEHRNVSYVVDLLRFGAGNGYRCADNGCVCAENG
jgi:hypothetical protein